jgi:acetyltransferase-like isoleucine patch superfamily enzyme
MLRTACKPFLKALARIAPNFKVRLALLRMAGYPIGRDVFIGEDLIIRDERDDMGMVRIGDRAALADRVTLVVSSNANCSRIRPIMGDVHGAIEICEDAWLGAGCIIFPGIRIGCGAVVGAGAVVNKDVPDCTIVIGIPAKKLRTLNPI